MITEWTRLYLSKVIWQTSRCRQYSKLVTDWKRCISEVSQLTVPNSETITKETIYKWKWHWLKQLNCHLVFYQYKWQKKLKVDIAKNNPINQTLTDVMILVIGRLEETHTRSMKCGSDCSDITQNKENMERYWHYPRYNFRTYLPLASDRTCTSRFAVRTSVRLCRASRCSRPLSSSSLCATSSPLRAVFLIYITVTFSIINSSTPTCDIDIAILSVRTSVCPCVTFRYSMETA